MTLKTHFIVVIVTLVLGVAYLVGAYLYMAHVDREVLKLRAIEYSKYK